MTTPGETPSGFVPPAELEEYSLVRPLGRGVMGEVYLARDRLLDREVAIKFIANARPDPATRERFFREARAIARLQHPNVVAVYRVAAHQGRPFLVSEYVRGQSLAELDSLLPAPRLIEIAVGLARGLAAAHRRGVLHRDIKPANAMLSDAGEVKLLDFGLAKMSAETREVAPEATSVVAPEATSVTAPLAGTVDGSTASTGRDPACSTLAATLAATGAAAGVATARARDQELSEPSPSSRPPVDLTAANQRVGTPLYMAPELWRGDPATVASDLYALGALLYELAAGHPPHRARSLAALAEQVQRQAPPLLERAPATPRALAAIIDRCVARDPQDRFTTAGELRQALETLSGSRSEAAAAAGPVLDPQSNPYRGLDAFEARHQALFFGRSGEVSAIVDHLRGQPVVVVAGDSGVGKSSLCRAGVGPAVAAGALGDGHPWHVVTASSGRGLLGLAAALAPLLGEPGEGPAASEVRANDDREPDERTTDDLAAALGRDPFAVARRLGRRLSGRRVLLVFEPLDELVLRSSVGQEREAEAVAEALAVLADVSWAWAGVGAALRILTTIRSDYLARAASLPGLGAVVTRSLYFVQPLREEALRQAICAPAALLSVRFESDAMVDGLVADTLAASLALPLLQFTLAELWEHRAGAVLPAAALDAMGGVAGALSRHADRVLARVPIDHRAMARRLLVSLVGGDGEPAARPIGELCAPGDERARVVLDTLVRGRLISVQQGAAGGDGDLADGTCQLAHDALWSSWDTLRQWASGDAAARAVHQRLERAARDWDRLGRRGDDLWRPGLVADAEQIERTSLSATERAFLRASGRRNRRRRMLRVAAVASVPALIAAAWLGVRVSAAVQRDAAVTAKLDEARAGLAGVRAQAAAATALREDAFREFDAHRVASAEELWATALAAQDEVEAGHRRVERVVESADALDPGRPETRALLVQSLDEQTAWADAIGDQPWRDELIERIATYDRARAADWSAPARVAVSVTPASATVELAAYHRDQDGRAREVATGLTPRSAPAAGAGARTALFDAVAPGSYVVLATAAGRALVRYPVVVGRDPARGEGASEGPGAGDIDLRLWLPPAEAVPAGFRYIPAGTSLLGSAADEDLRRTFFRAPPLHPVTLPAFLIAVHEVTFAEWIAYLDRLPAGERALRTPSALSLHAGHGDQDGQGLSLAKVGGAWQLTLRWTGQPLTAQAGEPIRYPTRTVRAAQDWLRMPVAGISFADAQAYAAWLDRSGRVPGARLCSHDEWARAARGSDGRPYPGGDQLTAADANIDITYGRVPGSFGADSVGTYPGGRSPFAIEDLAGNVWEWVASAADGAPMFRGGSWYQGQLTARAENRDFGESQTRYPLLGLRMCAAAPRP